MRFSHYLQNTLVCDTEVPLNIDVSIRVRVRLHPISTPYPSPLFCKIQDGWHIGIRANGNIIFLIAYTIKFPKMYSFDTLHKILATLHSEPDYIVH